MVPDISDKKKGTRAFEDFGRKSVRKEQMHEAEKDFGDCAAPKIIVYAQGQDPLTPISLVEEWCVPDGAEGRGMVHGQIVAPCKDKCEELLPQILVGRQKGAQRGKDKVSLEEKKLNEQD